jgi:O-antigen/teichoic acid export membrane protein
MAPEGGPVSTRLTRAAYLNSIAALLDFGSTMAVSLLVTPVLLRALDTSLFGVWKILQQVVNYMVLVDGRPTQALKWVIAADQASTDLVAKRRIVATAVLTWLIYLPLLTVAGGALVWFAPTLTKVPPEDDLLVRLTCGVLVINFVLLGLGQIPASVLRGENQGYRRMGMAAILNLLGAALTIGAVKLGMGLVGVAAAQVVVTVSTGFFFYVVVKRALPWFGLARPAFRQVIGFVKLSGWYLAAVLVDRLLYATDVVVLGYVASSATVTPYVVTSFAATTTLALLGAVVTGSLPGLGGLLGRGEFDRVGQVRREMAAYSWVLVTAIGGTTLLLNRTFVGLWVGQDRYAGWAANLLIVVLAVQVCFIRNDAYLIDLTLKLRGKVLLGLASGLASLAVAWMLIPGLGIVGLCCGLLAGRAMLSVALPVLVRTQLHVGTRLSMSTLRRGVLTVACFAATAFLGEQVAIHNWIVWAAAAGLCSTSIALVCGVLGLGRTERQAFVHRARVLLPA